jgi:hypothetical protein
MLKAEHKDWDDAAAVPAGAADPRR